MTQGQIIFLNGTSSAGKSTLAAALQKTLPEPYLYLALDDYLARFSPSFWQDQGLGWSRFLPAAFSNKPRQQFQPGLGWLMLPQLISSFHQQVADKAQAGHSIILDHHSTRH
jgi:chloramphenicol 3-O phosphotransferase